MRKVLPDTNAYSSYLAGDKQVLEALSQAGIVYISIFVLGELHAGFKGGLKEKENLAILDTFLAKPTVQVLDATIETAELFGTLKNTLKKLGRPLPVNDVWIAAHAMETGSTIITHDRHFSEIPLLRLWKRS
jgi:tRNA(fMet)-specific endonuclease VapC